MAVSRWLLLVLHSLYLSSILVYGQLNYQPFLCTEIVLLLTRSISHCLVQIFHNFLYVSTSNFLLVILQTREELRNALEDEMRAFSVDKDLSSSYTISWNHQEFEVQYNSLSDEIKNGKHLFALWTERIYFYLNVIFHSFSGGSFRRDFMWGVWPRSNATLIYITFSFFSFNLRLLLWVACCIVMWN